MHEEKNLDNLSVVACKEISRISIFNFSHDVYPSNMSTTEGDKMFWDWKECD